MVINLQKYADLLVTYCLRVGPGQRVYIRSTALALPLIEKVQLAVLKAGGFPVTSISSSELDRQLIEFGNRDAWDTAGQGYHNAVDTFNAILTISAPENSRTMASLSQYHHTAYAAHHADTKTQFMTRSSIGDLKWCLCVYPTPALAQDAGMSTTEFTEFVAMACGLNEPDPAAFWTALSHTQQGIVDRLNQVKTVQYFSDHMDITFSVDGRRWINSDGRRNMPSGEVFSSPVENSVNGHVQFDFPLIYNGNELRDIRFQVKDGEIVEWTAGTGQATLDALMAIPGARRFGEVAIGTNPNIQRHTKNILFDEKIGGTIHMAIGASYPETGGLNESSVHLDFIAEMRVNGRILADGQLIYEKGRFLYS